MSWFKLKKPMGTSYRVDPGDIMNTKMALYQLGYYQPPKDVGIQPWTDDAMFTGIKNFQKKNGLRVDGFMAPDGPTEKALNSQIRRQTFGASLLDAEGGGEDPGGEDPGGEDPGGADPGGDNPGGDNPGDWNIGDGPWAYACPSWPTTCNAPPVCGQNPGPGDGPTPKQIASLGYNALNTYVARPPYRWPR